MKKVCLLILDGFGINEKTLEENSITKAENKPLFDKLFALPDYTRLEASGRAVGLNDGFVGGSEPGHLTIGAGKIVPQTILEVSDFLDKEEILKSVEYKNLLSGLEKSGKILHIAGMLGYDGVHSYQNQLHKILDLFPSNIKISLHLFSDGRDSPITESYKHLEDLTKVIKEKKNITISSISGRYYAMDRDNNWERTEKVIDVMQGWNSTKEDILALLKESHSRKVYDEFIEPSFFEDGIPMKKGDFFLHMNYRSDRATQIVKLVEKFLGKENIFTFIKCYPEYEGNIFLRKQNITNTLSEVLQKNGLTQLHLAETEKFAHVTKFFNGLRNGKIEGEEHILVPSHKIEGLYDKDPEMSAFEILEEFRKNSSKFDFYVVNLANGDLVGHSGVLEAGAIAVETLDKVTSEFIKICDENSIDLLITADHGNCEQMGTKEAPCNSHTTNLVPFWYISNGEIVKTKSTGGLANIAPTVLEIMGIEKPVDMFESLIIN